MSNRINGLFITLDNDYREDDVEMIINAIGMIKGVLKIEKNIITGNDYFERTKITYELKNKLYNFIETQF